MRAVCCTRRPGQGVGPPRSTGWADEFAVSSLQQQPPPNAWASEFAHMHQPPGAAWASEFAQAQQPPGAAWAEEFVSDAQETRAHGWVFFMAFLESFLKTCIL